MKGKIVLVPFPFTDLTAAKLRPALVLYEGKRDVVLAFISSKISAQPLEADVLLESAQVGFKKSGLKVDSLIKLDKLATVLKALILGELGELDEEKREEVNQKLQLLLKI